MARTPKAPQRRRKAPAEQRRAELIAATIRSVARRGLADTTSATVAREARLSQGIINLHFKSKDRLLVETLRYLADEYRAAWGAALAEAGPSPASRLEALVRMDFDPSVCDRNKLAVWFAFWAEVKTRPTYREICAARDLEYGDMLRGVCAAMVRAGRYRNVDAVVVADGLAALTDGLWLDLLVTPDIVTREQAEATAMAYLAFAFPRHFGAAAKRGGE